MLDDLFVTSSVEDEAAPQPAPQPANAVDYLAVVDELHSGRIKVSEEALAAQYRETGHDLATEFAALLDQARLALAGEIAQPEKLPAIDPETIATELGLGRPGIDYGQLRRSFAFANHPDRVPPHLHERAMIRMQVANMLIDEAKRKALAKRKR
ncbi:hypothetical protein [Mesorhizobium sp. Root157]|uniref:hypothetical protein n=1 Tax=Mesorhizobium sp. Root157 TaxID=1736477 RepID=UPI0009EC9DA7|nr:hypothetical protein [Mesorhizobium sp. Root157]